MSNKLLKLVLTVFAALVLGLFFWNGSMSIATSFIMLFLLCLTVYLLQKDYEFILKFMILVVFFIPFNYFQILNVLNFINLLTLFGCVLGIKFFYNTIILKKSHLNLNFIDKLYFLFLLSAGISSCFAKSVLGSINWIFYSIFTGFIVYKAVATLNIGAMNRVLRFFIISRSFAR